MIFVMPKSGPLAFAELDALAWAYGARCTQKGRILTADKDISLSRLTQSRFACGLWFECGADLGEILGRIGEMKPSLTDFAVRVDGAGEKARYEREIGAAIGGNADLSNPKNIVRAVLTGGRAFVGLQKWELEPKAFALRWRQRQYRHHVSLKPDFARFLVNLARTREGDTVLDPFCGMGSILIEAGLMGMKAVGSDIDAEMVRACRRNLEIAGLEGTVVQKGIAEFSVPKKVDAIVTDLPYGTAASLHGTKKEALYKIALEKFAELVRLGGFCVVVADRKLGTKRMRLLELYKIRVHGSLTRFVHVFKN